MYQSLYLHRPAEEKDAETFMPRVEFEPTIRVLEQVRQCGHCGRLFVTFSRNVIAVAKSRKMRWDVAYMEVSRNAFKN
jgi:hypothetical protein